MVWRVPEAGRTGEMFKGRKRQRILGGQGLGFLPGGPQPSLPSLTPGLQSDPPKTNLTELLPSFTPSCVATTRGINSKCPRMAFKVLHSLAPTFPSRLAAFPQQTAGWFLNMPRVFTPPGFCLDRAFCLGCPPQLGQLLLVF